MAVRHWVWFSFLHPTLQNLVLFSLQSFPTENGHDIQQANSLNSLRFNLWGYSIEWVLCKEEERKFLVMIRKKKSKSHHQSTLWQLSYTITLKDLFKFSVAGSFMPFASNSKRFCHIVILDDLTYTLLWYECNFFFKSDTFSKDDIPTPLKWYISPLKQDFKPPAGCIYKKVHTFR